MTIGYGAENLMEIRWVITDAIALSNFIHQA